MEEVKADREGGEIREENDGERKREKWKKRVAAKVAAAKKKTKGVD